MNPGVLDRWCERGILALVLGIVLIGPLAIGAVSTLGFLVIQGLTLGVILLWGCRFWLRSRPQLFWPPICWAVLAFALYAIGRYQTADIEYVARQELLRVMVYTFLFFAVLNNLHQQESVQVITFTLIFLAMAISFYAVFQFVTGSNRVWHYISPYHHRGSGTYISPNHLGGFLEMLLPLGLAYTLTSRLNPLPRIFLGYASVAILAGIAVTVSRGTWVSTIIALLLFFGVLLFTRGHRLPAFVLLVALVVGGFFFLPRTYSFQSRVKDVYSGGKLNDDARLDLWQPAFLLWQQNVWWGVGPAHFDYRFRPYRPEIIQRRPDRVHNDYLNTLTDWGLAGAIPVIAALVCLGLGLLKTWPVVRGTPREIGEKKSSNKFAFVFGASLGLMALLVHSLVDFNMHIPANAILAITLMALLTSHLRVATERYWLSAGPLLALLCSASLVAGLVYLGQQGVRRAAEYVWLERADAAPIFSPQQAHLLKHAYAAEPNNPETSYNIGECLRIQSREGAQRLPGINEGPDYTELATEAMQWHGRSMKLDPWDARAPLRFGMCLDWLERKAESGPYFARAAQLDPNGYFTAANIGLHYIELDDYAAAKPWFERSLRLKPHQNLIARSYLDIANLRLMEAATNQISARLNFPAVSSEPKGP